VLNVTLILRGTQINDSDHDALDDGWESTKLGSQLWGPKDDPDGDGFNNAREQAGGTAPDASNSIFAVDLTWWELAGYRRARLTWPSAMHYNYSVYSGTNLSSPGLMTNVPGNFAETEWLGLPFTREENRFYKVFAAPNP
jgi:hypothetical protein